MRVAGAAAASWSVLLNSRRLLAELVEPAPGSGPPAMAASPSSTAAAAASRVPEEVGDGHGARIVHQHRDHVLLRPQRGHAQRRMPEQKQEQRRHARFRAARWRRAATPLSMPWLRRTCQKSSPPRPEWQPPSATAARASEKRNGPSETGRAGYLKRISNMESTPDSGSRIYI